MFKVVKGDKWIKKEVKSIKFKGTGVWRCERCGEPLGDFGAGGT